MLCQLLGLQVVEKQGHFALFAQAWAAYGGRGARATRAQPGGKERQGEELGWTVWECGGRRQSGAGREGEGTDSQVRGVSQPPLGCVTLLFHSGPEATYNLF